MIVVLVYRPEATSGAGLNELPHSQVPLEGVEVYGMYYEAESKFVDEMIEGLAKEHPAWHFHIEPHVKSYVGFHTDRLKVPKQAGYRE
jgi:hypothetical protein